MVTYPSKEAEEVIVCPMCGSTEHTDLSSRDSIGNYRTEIWSCQMCPCVWFENYNQLDWMDVGEALGLKEVEQI